MLPLAPVLTSPRGGDEVRTDATLSYHDCLFSFFLFWLHGYHASSSARVFCGVPMKSRVLAFFFFILTASVLATSSHCSVVYLDAPLPAPIVSLFPLCPNGPQPRVAHVVVSASLRFLVSLRCSFVHVSFSPHVSPRVLATVLFSRPVWCICCDLLRVCVCVEGAFFFFVLLSLFVLLPRCCFILDESLCLGAFVTWFSCTTLFSTVIR